jgi:hypothetical protein
VGGCAAVLGLQANRPGIEQAAMDPIFTLSWKDRVGCVFGTMFHTGDAPNQKMTLLSF